MARLAKPKLRWNGPGKKRKKKEQIKDAITMAKIIGMVNKGDKNGI